MYRLYLYPAFKPKEVKVSNAAQDRANRPLSSCKTSPLVSSCQEQILSLALFFSFLCLQVCSITIFISRQRCLLALHCMDYPGYFMLVLAYQKSCLRLTSTSVLFSNLSHKGVSFFFFLATYVIPHALRNPAII